MLIKDSFIQSVWNLGALLASAFRTL